MANGIKGSRIISPNQLSKPDESLPNLLANHLKILFVGINPGLRSAATGHHFAGVSNRFWRLLADSELTPVRFSGEQDSKLLELGYGITNIVPRPTANAAELKRHEFEAGAKVLMNLLQQYHPCIAAYVGKDVYRFLAKKNHISWGLQLPSVIDGVTDFVLPNPSGLNRMPYPEQLKWYLELKMYTNSL